VSIPMVRMTGLLFDMGPNALHAAELIARLTPVFVAAGVIASNSGGVGGGSGSGSAADRPTLYAPIAFGSADDQVSGRILACMPHVIQGHGWHCAARTCSRSELTGRMLCRSCGVALAQMTAHPPARSSIV
jgi:hypothetical protein